MRSTLLFGLILTIPVTVSADVRCPRILSEHNADTTDLGRFRQFHKWKDKTDQDLAIAVWQYLCGHETGLYHMNEVIDGNDSSKELSTVRDPLKIMNVYNVGYCGIFGPTLDGIFQGVGFKEGRAFSVPGWNHNTTEVWYDGAWHYFDLDVRGALMKPDGIIASVAEAQKDRSLWVNPARRIEPFFPHDHNKTRVFEIYRNSRIDYFYHWFQGGHTMDFTLRQGESLTRYWQPQGGRWHHIPDYNKNDRLMRLIESDPAGYKSNHRDFSKWTQGNGLWVYAPNLTANSSDFTDGVLAAGGLAPSTEGLHLTSERGEAIFEIFTPWIIVPKVNDPADAHDDNEASMVTLDSALPVKLAVSTDNGTTWKQTPTVQAGVSVIDLTEWVKGTYGYWLRIEAKGQPGQAAVRSMKIETWVQVAPISLPRLKRGRNKCRFEMGDRYGLATLPTLIRPNVCDPDDLKQYATQRPTDYDPGKLSSRIRGDVIVKYRAPVGRKICWLTIGGAFTTHQNNGAEQTDNRIAYAIDEAENFTEIYHAEVPTWVNHWKYQWDQDLRLADPAEVVYVRYTGKPAVNVVRATLHCEPATPTSSAIEITHGYLLRGKLVEKKVTMDAPGDYAVTCDGDPENVLVRMAVPSK